MNNLLALQDTLLILYPSTIDFFSLIGQVLTLNVVVLVLMELIRHLGVFKIVLKGLRVLQLPFAVLSEQHGALVDSVISLQNLAHC